jgi:nucleoside-diphosphate-sugar epimerase
MRKILITGNMGYVGPVVARHLRKTIPDAYLMGFDIGYYARNLTTRGLAPESYLNVQHFGDMRKFPAEILNGVDTIIHLAAISNDPIGNKFETMQARIWQKKQNLPGLINSFSPPAAVCMEQRINMRKMNNRHSIH